MHKAQKITSKMNENVKSSSEKKKQDKKHTLLLDVLPGMCYLLLRKQGRNVFVKDAPKIWTIWRKDQ